MIRRQFLRLATLTGATGLASFGALKALREDSAAGAPDATETQSVMWHVRGFTCVTCAVGLETLLRREEGVVAASATWPGGMVTIQYQPGIVSQAALRSTIAELGFTAEEEKS